MGSEDAWIEATLAGWSLTDPDEPEDMRLALLSGYLRQFAIENYESGGSDV